jgi:predicted RNA binding protein YcfA (HicA-like mRNA interferase family)
LRDQKLLGTFLTVNRLPILSGRAIVKALAGIGYQEVRQRGSHIRLACPGKISITVPNYKVVGRGLLRKILRDAELSVEEFMELV